MNCPHCKATVPNLTGSCRQCGRDLATPPQKTIDEKTEKIFQDRILYAALSFWVVYNALYYALSPMAGDEDTMWTYILITSIVNLVFSLGYVLIPFAIKNSGLRLVGFGLFVPVTIISIYNFASAVITFINYSS